MDWGKLLDGTAAQLGAGNVVKVESVTYQTGESDIFAGGDCATGPKFTIDAIATGKSGAISIHRFLRGNHLSLRREREYKAFDKDIGDYSGYDKMPRQRPHHAAASKAVETMSDTRATFTEEQLRKEAERCLGCGISIVDPKKCLGCGVCANRCEFDAIKVRKVYEDAPASGPQEFVMNLMGNVRTRMQNIMAKAAAAGQKHTVDVTDVKGVNEFKAGADKE
jgi:ferredoxin